MSHDGVPLPKVDLLVMFPNKTAERAYTDKNGNAQIDLHTTHLPMTVFAAAPGLAANLKYNWIPTEGSLSFEMQSLQNGGSVIFRKAKGNIPSLSGSLNPIRDTHNRTYLYASNIAINEGKPQPVFFSIGEDLHLTDAKGKEFMVRIAEIIGESALIEYRSGSN